MLAEGPRRLIDRLAREDGVALVLALVIMAALAAGATTVMVQGTDGQRTATRAKADQAAYSLAEAGLASAVAVLSEPSNNALDPNLLPTRRTDYRSGYALWGGTLDTSTGTWTLSASGVSANATGGTVGEVRRTVGAMLDVEPSYQQPLNNMAWNYIWAKRSGYGCDMTIGQSVEVATPLVVEGSLCLQNTATITNGPLVVRGSLYMSQKQNGVGSAGSPINEAHIGGGCQWWNGKVDTPCKGASNNVHAKVLDQDVPALNAPAADWTSWYLNASPGPYYPCAETSGTPPVFDTDQYSPPYPDASHRNGSLTVTPFNLTPPVSYTCKNAGGEISWDAQKLILTLNGTVYIDGSAYITNGKVNQYQGVGSLYLTGTFLLKNSQLCAGVAAGTCNVKSWNPNTEMLVVVADGNGGQVNVGDSIQLVSSTFQGALYATNAIENDTTSQVDGPMVGSTVMLGQSVETTFPSIKIVPSGMPSNPVVYAQPQAPYGYTG